MRTLVTSFVRAVLALSLFLGGAERASAARPEKRAVLVLRLEAPASFGSDLVQKLDQAVRQEVASSKVGLKLLPPPALDLESMKVAAGCGDDGAACLANIGSTLGAKDVLRVVLTGTKDKARLEISLVRVKDQKARGAQVELVELGDEALDELKWHVASVLGDKRPQPPGAIALAARDPSALEGVEIFLDDKRLPKSDLQKIAPGEHRLEVRKEGFDAVIWTGAVRPGRETKVAVDLQRARVVAGSVTKPDAAKSADPERTSEKKAAQDATPEIGARPSAIPERADTSSGVVPPVTAETVERPHLVYTWVLTGAAAVATGVGVYFWSRQRGLESDLEADCQGTTVNGVFRCRAGYQSCADNPDRAECKEGQTTETATFIAFPLAGALAGAAIAAFFFEDGPAALFDTGPSMSDKSSSAKPGVRAGLFPTDGGFGASFGARY